MTNMIAVKNAPVNTMAQLVRKAASVWQLVLKLLVAVSSWLKLSSLTTMDQSSVPAVTSKALTPTNLSMQTNFIPGFAGPNVMYLVANSDYLAPGEDESYLLRVDGDISQSVPDGFELIESHKLNDGASCFVWSLIKPLGMGMRHSYSDVDPSEFGDDFYLCCDAQGNVVKSGWTLDGSHPEEGKTICTCPDDGEPVKWKVESVRSFEAMPAGPGVERVHCAIVKPVN